MSNSSEIPQIDPGLRARAARDFALYGAARLGLFLVLTVVIQGLAVLIDAPVPLAISALLALLVAFPLSMFVFKKRRASEAAAEAEEERRRRERHNKNKGG